MIDAQDDADYHQLKDEYKAIRDGIPYPLALISADLNIIWINKAGINDLVFRSEPIQGKCYKLFHDIDSACPSCPVLKCFASGQEEQGRVITPNGHIWDVKAIPVKDSKGRVTKVLDFAVNVTEKLKMETEAVKTAHLASIGQLAAGVAHEINNPITGIINYADILLSKSEPGTKSHDIANRIIREGERVASIVKSLLSFARQRKAENIRISIDEILAETIALSGALLRKDGISLTQTIPADLSKIIGNPQQIQQVFLNVINNARYALNERYKEQPDIKKIDIFAENITMSGNPRVRIVFSDNGHGITEDVLSKVFMPFFSTKPNGCGTGLGLSISHNIIKEHGGNISIESFEMDGSKLIIDLPAAETVATRG
jgi:two-component system NtrC family sensor kinase